MVASSGFYQSPGPPSLGNVRGIVLAHHAAIDMASKIDPFFVILLFTVALAAAGAIRSK
jgi:hypothetical protein